MTYTACTVRSCSKCDEDPGTCEACTAGYELSNNECSKSLLLNTCKIYIQVLVKNI